jgi:hypothetical protein
MCIRPGKSVKRRPADSGEWFPDARFFFVKGRV